MKNLQQLQYKISVADAYQLEQADVLVVPKSGISLIKHMIIYAGVDAQQNHWYLENNPQFGVRWIPGDYVDQTYPSPQVRRFNGTATQRSQAIERGKFLLGKPYHLTQFNCEHYANYIQTGALFSPQSNNGIGIAALGLTALLLSKL